MLEKTPPKTPDRTSATWQLILKRLRIAGLSCVRRASRRVGLWSQLEKVQLWTNKRSRVLLLYLFFFLSAAQSLGLRAFQQRCQQHKWRIKACSAYYRPPRSYGIWLNGPNFPRQEQQSIKPRVTLAGALEPWGGFSDVHQWLLRFWLIVNSYSASFRTRH